MIVAVDPSTPSEIILSTITQHIHTHALTQPFPLFEQMACRQIAEALSLATSSWLAATPSSSENKFVRFVRTTDDSQAGALDFDLPGEHSQNTLHFELTTRTPKLPNSFWQALAHSMVCLRDNIARTLTNSALNAPANSGVATASKSGEILYASEAFYQYINQALPDWQGNIIPDELLNPANRDSHGVSWSFLYVHIMEQENALYFVAHPDRRRTPLTTREMAIAAHIAQGYTFKQIGSELSISHSTAASHLYNIYAKLNIRRRSELIEWLNNYRSNGLTT